MLSAYDHIGVDYRQTRKEDPRLARLIARELQGAGTVVNAGAGAGSYEPRDRFVVAVEPSAVMLPQQPPNAAPAVQATAERLPFGDAAFERIVLLTWAPSSDGFWLMRDCFPQFLEAFWRRPEAYLNAEIRSGISSFATCRDLSPLQRLEGDLVTGEWQRRYSDLLDQEELDIGYRLVVGRPTSGCT